MSFSKAPDLTIYKPEYNLEIDKEAVPSKKNPLPITSASVKESFDGAGCLTINISDPEDKWTDDPLLRVGNSVTLDLGYVNKLTKFINGRIETVSVSYPSSGTPQITVTAFDRIYELLSEKPSLETVSFEDKTIADIIKAIAKAAGMKPDVDDTEVCYPSYMLHSKKTYLEHIQDLAELVAYDVFLRDGTLHVKMPDLDKSAIITLEWGKNLIRFNPSLNISEQITKVWVKGRNSKGEKITGSAPSVSGATSLGGGKSACDLLKEIKKGRELWISKPVENEEEANMFAEAKLKKVNQRLVTGSCSCVGDPEIRPGEVVEIKNVAKLFRGKYTVTGASHEIGGSGYVTSFEVRRGGVGK